jgi:hypothetical protein
VQARCVTENPDFISTLQGMPNFMRYRIGS